MLNGQFGLKIKYPKKMRKMALLSHYSGSMQKTARKNSLYSKNESILKMAKNGHNLKAIAHAKYSVYVRGVARGGFQGFWNPPFGL